MSNDDHTRPDPATNHTPSLNGTSPDINDHDLLGIVEGTIDQQRLLLIRGTLAADKPLLARLSRMKRDREALQTAQLSEHAPPDIVHAAMARASRTTLDLNTLAELDAAPLWRDHGALGTPMHASPSDDAEHTGGRVSPSARRHRHRIGWKAKAALAASLLLVATIAVLTTGMLGGLNPNSKPVIPRMPQATLADADQRTGGIDQELADKAEDMVLQRAELAEELMRLANRSGNQAPALDELDLDEILRNTESIDEMLAALAEEMLSSGGLFEPTTPGAPRTEQAGTGTTIDLSGINPAIIGGLARAGKLHITIESADATRTALRLLMSPKPGSGQTTETLPAFAAELIQFADMDASQWAGARPMAGNTLASPLPEDHAVQPAADPQQDRVQRLLREIHERAARSGPDRERTDPVYRVTMDGLLVLDEAAAGRAVLDALGRLVGPNDQIAFYELAGTDDAGARRPAAATIPGFTVQLYVRDRR